MPAFHLLSSISELSGVGSKRKLILNDHGISTLQDLLYYFPRRHLDRTSITPIRKLEKGMVATLIGQVETFGEKSVRRGKLFQVILSDGTGILTLTWFNGVRLMKKLFHDGFVERNTASRPYTYSITEKGRGRLGSKENVVYAVS